MRGESQAATPGPERGATSVMMLGFAAMLVLMVAVVVDASAAYLQRQGLRNLADGAALSAADSGAAGVWAVPGEGEALVPADPVVKATVDSYLAASGARDRYPDLRVRVDVAQASGTVTVTLSAPLSMPLEVPGVSGQRVVARSAAAVVVER